MTKIYNGTPSLSIAAASLVANVTFRQIMAAHGERYPAYGFERHAGYPSPAHLVNLAHHSPSLLRYRHNRLVQRLAASNAGAAPASAWGDEGRSATTRPVANPATR